MEIVEIEQCNEVEQFKICRKCGEEKKLTKFVKRKRCLDGYTQKCKDCNKNSKVKNRCDENGNRQCNNCKKFLNLKYFAKNSATFDGLQYWCKICNNIRGKELREIHVEKLIKQRKILNRRLKLEILNAYGNKCICCKEKNIEFLTIDHINGNGSEHRKEVGAGTAFYHWLKKNNFPSEFRILCFNCNCSMGIFGYCPHNNLK